MQEHIACGEAMCALVIEGRDLKARLFSALEAQELAGAQALVHSSPAVPLCFQTLPLSEYFQIENQA